MIETVMIILTILLCVGAYIAERNRRQINRRLKQLAQEGREITEDPSEKTIRLIGRDTYADMCRRVQEITRSHHGQQRAIFPLTLAPASANGCDRLHKLLPGDRLQLNYTVESGMPTICVFSRGVCVGRLAFDEVDALMGILKDRKVTGVYVAEQNCYDIPDALDLDIILYLEPKLELSTSLVEMLPMRQRDTHPLRTLDFGLN